MSVLRMSCGLKPARQVVRGHHLLHATHDEVDERTLHEREEVPHGRRHDVTAGRVGKSLFERAGEVFDDDDRFRARIAKRVIDFAGRVERIDVHDDHARAQTAEDGHDVLQEVRHHDRDAIPGYEAEALQVGGEVPGEGAHLAVRDVHAHVGVARAVGEFAGRLVEDGRKTGESVGVDFVRNAFRIGVVPNAIGHE